MEIETPGAELLAVFEDEYRAHMRALKAQVGRPVVNAAATADVFRRIHSLKGAARAVGVSAVEALAHGLETMLVACAREGRGLDAEARDAVQRGLDAIEAEMERPAPEAPPDAASRPDEAARAPTRARTNRPERYVQLPQSWIDGFAASYRGVVAAIEAQRRAWEAVDRLFPQHMRHQSGEAGRTGRALDAIRRDRDRTEGALRDALARIEDDVHASALVVVGEVFAPLVGMARQMARDITGRDMDDVALVGMAQTVDRHTVQVMRDPVIQMIRNAIAHGAEPPAARRAAGKPEGMRLALSVAIGAGWLAIEIVDDGRGPDVAAIRTRAEALGILPPGQQATEEALFALVFAAGFSTRTSADALAGRGMGLSIVAERVRALGGHVAMRRATPAGTRITISLPLPRRERTVLSVHVAGQVWGVDGAAVVRLARARPDAIEERGGIALWRAQDLGRDEGGDAPAPVRLVMLATLLGQKAPQVMPDNGWLVAVLRDAAGDVGLIVDAITDARVFLAEAADLPGLDRALAPELCWPSAEMPVFVLDTGVLLQRARAARGNLPGSGAPLTRLLVVDDTATVRALSRVVLRAEGFDVMSVSDGAAALDFMRSVAVDCVITDLEMPGLDGPGLLAAMAGDAGLRAVPVVVMTGHDLAREVRRPSEFGPNVRAVIAKQGADQHVLIATVRSVLDAGGRGASQGGRRG